MSDKPAPLDFSGDEFVFMMVGGDVAEALQQLVRSRGLYLVDNLAVDGIRTVIIGIGNRVWKAAQ